MKLRSYVCPECDGHNHRTSGARLGDGTLQVKCGRCGAVETIGGEENGGDAHA